MLLIVISMQCLFRWLWFSVAYFCDIWRFTVDNCDYLPKKKYELLNNLKFLKNLYEISMKIGINYMKIGINYMKIGINYMKIGINYMKLVTAWWDRLI